MLPHRHYSLTCGETDVFERDGVLNTAADDDGFDLTETTNSHLGEASGYGGVGISLSPYNTLLNLYIFLPKHNHLLLLCCYITYFISAG